MIKDEVVLDPSKAPANVPKIHQPPKDIDISTLPIIGKLNRDEFLDDMEHIAKRSIGLHLSEMDIEFSQTALESFYDLFSTHYNTLLRNLQRITQTQRRFKASPKDIKLLLKEHEISIRELEDELMQTRSVSDNLKSKKRKLEKQAEAVINSSFEESEIGIHDPSYVFYSQHDDIAELVPVSHRRPKGIPSWLPQFPPDHTYLRTPNFLNRITDQRTVRTKVAQESRLGEKALDHLISYEVKLEKTEILKKIPEEKKVQVQYKDKEEFKEKSTYNIWIKETDKNFDIVKYSGERLKYIEKKKRKKEEKKKSIDHEYLNMITHFSFYSNEDKSEKGIHPQQYIDSQFQQAISSLTALGKLKEERKAKRKVLQAEEDKKRDKLKKQINSKFEEFNSFENTNTTFDNLENFEKFGTGDEVNAFTFSGDVSDSDNGRTQKTDKGDDFIIKDSKRDNLFEVSDLQSDKMLEPEFDLTALDKAEEPYAQQSPPLSQISTPTSGLPTEAQTPSIPPQSFDNAVTNSSLNGTSQGSQPPDSSISSPTIQGEEEGPDEDGGSFDDLQI